MFTRYQQQGTLKKYILKGGKWLLIAELASLGVSYLGWRQINRNQDVRYYLLKNHNWILESYYQFGEKISSDCKVREYDLECWRRDGKL